MPGPRINAGGIYLKLALVELAFFFNLAFIWGLAFNRENTV